MALVMDGHATNQAMVGELGGSLRVNNFGTYFNHPSNDSWKVYIFFDACHMLKLVRNMLQVTKDLAIPSMGTVNWSYIEKLNELQESEGLRAANKLTTAHVQFHQQKMNVKLAAQTLSSSVAKALEFQYLNKCLGFEDCMATSKFISMVDHMFDIFNSRTPKASGYKKPLTAKSVIATRAFLQDCKKCLLSRSDSTVKRISESRRHLSALGFVVNIDSLLAMSQEIFDSSSQYCQKYLLTYKLSQDHLELYFSSVRRYGGWNNNPSAKQFSYAYRALLKHASVSAATSRNFLQQDHTVLMH